MFQGLPFGELAGSRPPPPVQESIGALGTAKMHPRRRRQLFRLTFARLFQLRGRLPQLGKFAHHEPFGFRFRHFLAELLGMVHPKLAFHRLQHLLFISLLTMKKGPSCLQCRLGKKSAIVMLIPVFAPVAQMDRARVS